MKYGIAFFTLYTLHSIQSYTQLFYTVDQKRGATFICSFAQYLLANEDRFLADRTYMYTFMYNMIGYWHHPVVRLSVCYAALWLSGSVYMAKRCTCVFLAGMFLFVSSDTFAVC